MDKRNIRNFSIIAHVDHGKSTLADRLLEFTGSITKREMVDQILDTMDIERERGITIKAQAVRINYRADDGEDYIFNLVDTPGHVDFSYEVSRSLAACEGVLLVIDAAQGIEAQTLANFYLAVENNLEVIPVINKIDLPNADPKKIKQQIEDILGIDAETSILASAKEGVGIKEILEAIVEKIPPPSGTSAAPLRALIVDSWFNSYHGAVPLIRVVDGEVRPGQRITMMSTGADCEISEVGVFTPRRKPVERLGAGEVGYIYAGIKQIRDTKVGDTITSFDNPASQALPGFKDAKPMVFAGLYPVESNQYEELREALDKLHLNDSAFTFEPESSLALGFGFRCGFLGLLHMDVIKERLEREFQLTLLTTIPTVVYRALRTNGEWLRVENPSYLPPSQELSQIEEPFVLAHMITPEEFVGNILRLAQERRGIQKKFEYLDDKKVLITYEFPLNEIVIDFYDRLKSLTRGYASFDYEYRDYRISDLVKLDILINGDPVDALSLIIHKDKAYQRGKDLTQKMRELIPRQMFEVAIQAAIGNKVISRETVKALRKNVTAKCYGGDITRKRKLLEKQKEGKKRMKQVGKVEIPQEAFMALLKTEN